MENYYQILSLADYSEIEVVKEAYRALSKKYHPDMNNGDKDKMVKYNLAYEVLGNPEKKEIYDRQLKDYLSTEDNTEIHQNNEVYSKNRNKTFGEKIVDNVNYAVNSFVKYCDELERQRENAYYEGCDMTDWTLIKEYLRSIGPKRKGLSKVLLERDLLYEDDNGDLVPTERFQRIRRG